MTRQCSNDVAVLETIEDFIYPESIFVLIVGLLSVSLIWALNHFLPFFLLIQFNSIL